MELITAEEVIRWIEWYFQGGALRELTSREVIGSRPAIARTVENPFVDGDEGKAIRGRSDRRSSVGGCPLFNDRGFVRVQGCRFDGWCQCLSCGPVRRLPLRLV